MHKLAIVSVVSFFVLAGSHVFAETLVDGRAFNPSSAIGKYLFSDDFYKGMLAFAHQSDRALGVACDERYEIKPLSIVVIKPVELPDGATQATAGVWSYRYDAVRCGSSKRYNLAMIVQSGAAPRPAPLLPGNTIASAQLAADAMKAVIVKASFSLNKCDEARIFDTAVTANQQTVTEGDKTYYGVWKENWTFKGCGNQVVVPITFIPDGKGGTSFVAGK
jgi:hypothetical protein